MKTEILTHARLNEEFLTGLDLKLFYGDQLYEHHFSHDVSRFHKFEIEMTEDSQDYEYQYQAYYRSGGMITSERRTTGDRILGISPTLNELGIFEGSLELVTREVDVAVVAVELEGESQKIVLARGRNRQYFRFFLGRSSPQEFRYRVKYQLSQGPDIETPWISSRDHHVVVLDPFQEVRQISFVAPAINWDTTKQIVLNIRQTDQNDWETQYGVILSVDSQIRELHLPIINSQKVRINYHGTVQVYDGSDILIPETEVDEGVIVLDKKLVA